MSGHNARLKSMGFSGRPEIEVGGETLIIHTFGTEYRDDDGEWQRGFFASLYRDDPRSLPVGKVLVGQGFEVLWGELKDEINASICKLCLESSA